MTMCHHTTSRELSQLRPLIKKRKGNKLRKKKKGKTCSFLLNFSDLCLRFLPQEFRALSEMSWITIIQLNSFKGNLYGHKMVMHFVKSAQHNVGKDKWDVSA